MTTLLQKQREKEFEKLAEIEAARKGKRKIIPPSLTPAEYQDELGFIVREICDNLGVPVIFKSQYHCYAKELDKDMRKCRGTTDDEAIEVVQDKWEKKGLKKSILNEILEEVKSSVWLKG